MLTLALYFAVLPYSSVSMVVVLHSVKILRWLEANPLLADKVFEGVVRVITLTGDRTGASRKADVLFKDRHWESIQRINCRGRWVCVVHVAHSRNFVCGEQGVV